MPVVTEKPTLETWEELAIGDAVIFIDPTGRSHPALVTAVHGPQSKESVEESFNKTVEHFAGPAGDYYRERGEKMPNYTVEDLQKNWTVPSINLVYVLMEADKNDPYGRQINRATSVPHEAMQSAHGYYYRRANN